MAGDPDLDGFDLQILAILQNDNLTTQQEIGDRVALSSAAVSRRIRRLQDRGVIKANVAILNPADVGRHIIAAVEVSVVSELKDEIQSLSDHFASQPEVQQCYYVTGNFDFLLMVSATSMADYNRLCQKLFVDQGNIASFKTFFVTQTVKAGSTLPVQG